LARRGDIVKQSQGRIEDEKEIQDDLKRKLARAQSQEFIERQAREKLNLGREGEVVLILPTISLPPEVTPTPIDNSGNWKKWAKVFL
jgi:cell division protein FtsB